jgi:hypothetical protein
MANLWGANVEVDTTHDDIKAFFGLQIVLNGGNPYSHLWSGHATVERAVVPSHAKLLAARHADVGGRPRAGSNAGEQNHSMP